MVEEMDSGDGFDIVPFVSSPLSSVDPGPDQEFRKSYGAKLKSVTRSANTQRSYESDFIHFERWCSSRGLTPLPASEETIIGYVLYWGDPEQDRLDGDIMLRPNTLERRVFGIKAHHSQNRQEWPKYLNGEDDLITGTLRYIGIAQKATSTRSNAISRRKLEAIVREMPETAIGVRNRAILLIGFYAALRRSEIVNINLDDITFSDEGMHDDEGVIVHLRESKTDKTGEGEDIFVNYMNTVPCPVVTLQEWIKVRGNEPGPLFTNLWNPDKSKDGRLSPPTVNRILKKALEDMGEDVSKYSAHSLRSGFATSAAREGVPPHLIKKQTRHSSYEMVDRYIHAGGSFRDNATRFMK